LLPVKQKKVFDFAKKYKTFDEFKKALDSNNEIRMAY